MKAAISSGMHYNYEYDIMGRIAKKSASGRTLLSYHYDLNGNLTSQKDVTGKVTEYTYNALDLIEKVTDNGIIVGEYSYYPDGTTKSLKNGTLYTEYTFDTDKNLTSLKTRLGTEVLTDNHYTYDRNGNRTEKRQIHGNTHYTYDALNQLTKVQYPTYTEELYYDKAGNRTKRTVKGIEELYKYDPRNRLTEYTKGGVKTNFIYDNAGNLLRDDKAKYTYDAFNRTEKVETFDGHVQINRYDAEGLRYEMEEDKRLVQFIFRGDEIVGEEKDNKVIRYIRGYDLIASDAESARTYYHYASDEMGSITHLIEENQIRNHYEYDVWGNTTTCEETVENRFRFNGQQYDPISQQYYLRARFYNPVIGRFTQEDTYRGDGLNLYAYCANNPVYYVDPSGYWCEKKEKVFRDLLKERGLTDADLAKDPELKIRMMAEASNIVKNPKYHNKIKVYDGIDPNILNQRYDIIVKDKKRKKDRVFKNMPIRLSDDLAIDMPFVGVGSKKLIGKDSNALGYLRDDNYYFKELYKIHPEYFSLKNIKLMNSGLCPVNDKQFRSYFPEYDVKGLRSNTLVHHHVGGMQQAVAVPQGIHVGFGAIHNNEKALGIWYNGFYRLPQKPVNLEGSDENL